MKANELTFPGLNIQFFLDWFWFIDKDKIYYSFEREQLELFRDSQNKLINSFQSRMAYAETFSDFIVRSTKDEKYKLLAIETVAEGTILFSLKGELND